MDRKKQFWLHVLLLLLHLVEFFWVSLFLNNNTLFTFQDIGCLLFLFSFLKQHVVLPTLEKNMVRICIFNFVYFLKHFHI